MTDEEASDKGGISTAQWPMSMRVTTECATCAPDDVTHPPLLVVLHGWGQTAVAFLRGFRLLARKGWLVAAPQAPHPFYVDPERGRVGYSWLTREHRDAAVQDTNAYLMETLAMLSERFAFDQRRVAILGFSQGSSVAFRYLAEHPEGIGAVASCCSDLPPDTRPVLEHIAPRPAFTAYCPHDRIVPPSFSREAAVMLAAYGWPTTEFAFDGGHRITPELVSRLGDWLDAALPPR